MPARTHREESTARAASAPTRSHLEETRAFWQPYATAELTREDAREILANVSGFFRVLRAWSEEDRRAAQCAHPGAQDAAHDERD